MPIRRENALSFSPFFPFTRVGKDSKDIEEEEESHCDWEEEEEDTILSDKSHCGIRAERRLCLSLSLRD